MPFGTSGGGGTIDLFNRAAATLAVSAAAAQTPALEDGEYDVWCSADVYLKVNPVANNVTTANGYLLRANNTLPLSVRAGHKIGAIAGGAGTLSYHKVG